jgi:CRP-like cAMP-binding protein
VRELERIVRSHAFCRELPRPHQDLLARCARPVSFDPGMFLLREGQPAETCFLVHDGSVSLEFHDPARGARRIGTLAAGDVAGLAWLFPPFRWHLDARAIERVETLALSGPCLRAAMDSDPEFGYSVARKMLILAYDRLQRAELHGLDLYRDAP